jgi:hypothetical protein
MRKNDRGVPETAETMFRVHLLYRKWKLYNINKDVEIEVT